MNARNMLVFSAMVNIIYVMSWLQEKKKYIFTAILHCKFNV